MVRCVIRAQRSGSNHGRSMCSLHCSPRYLPLVRASHLTIAMVTRERSSRTTSIPSVILTSRRMAFGAGCGHRGAASLVRVTDFRLARNKFRPISASAASAGSRRGSPGSPEGDSAARWRSPFPSLQQGSFNTRTVKLEDDRHVDAPWSAPTWVLDLIDPLRNKKYVVTVTTSEYRSKLCTL